MKRNILIFLLTLFVLSCPAESKKEKKTLHLGGFVIDPYIREGADSVLIFLMNKDSVALDSIKAQIRNDYDQFAQPTANYDFTVPALSASFIVKAVARGCKTGYTHLDIKKISHNKNLGFLPIRLKPLEMSGNMMEGYLDEVVVKATKIKMVNHGDTLIYNTDAFNLAEGNMLEDLIRKMPGAKLTKDGQIFFNGKLVQNLLLNGRKSFSDDSGIMLENLPAYTVQKIKVYDKAGPMSKMKGHDMGDNIFVMDVILKKQYAIGYMGNLEAGKGTNGRYLAKAFGLQFSDKVRIIVFGNINNQNDNQRAELKGEWAPQDMPTGLLTRKMAGISYGYSLPKLGEYSCIVSNNVFSHTDGDNRTQENSQTFLSGGDSFRKSQSSLLSKSTSWSSHNEFLIEGDELLQLEQSTKLDLSYTKTEGLGHSASTISDSTSWVNQLLTKSSAESKNFNMEFSHQGKKKFSAIALQWTFRVGYHHLESKEFSLNDVQYADGKTPRDFRNNYLDKPNQRAEVNGLFKCMRTLCSLDVTAEYEYSYQFNKTSNMLYRLDKLENRDSTLFDLLPSTAEALARVLDEKNSYDYHDYKNQHHLKLSLSHSLIWLGEKGRWSLDLPIFVITHRLFYNREERHDVSQKKVFFEPGVNIMFGKENMNGNLSADISSEMPDPVSMVDYIDNSAPLSISMGNPNLKDTHVYHISCNFQVTGEQQQDLSLRADYHQIDNAIAYGLTFNKSTGVTTTKPVSVNGNWDIDASIGYTRTLDKTQKLTFDNQLGLNYRHNIDMANVEGSEENRRSIVNNYHFDDQLKLDYAINDGHSIGLHANGNYDCINSPQAGFATIHAGDYSVGANLSMDLLWRFHLTTDLSMFARRGYQSADMNTTNWVWNAQLTRSFIKGKLLAKLQGFDILHQLSNTQYAMNAQGRTETWHNSIPQYVMLSLSWQFNVNPKKKDK